MNAQNQVLASAGRRLSNTEIQRMNRAMQISGNTVTHPEHLFEILQPSGVLGATDRRPATYVGNNNIAIVGDAAGDAILTKYAYARGLSGALMTAAKGAMNNVVLARICDDSGLTDCIMLPRGHVPYVTAREKATAVEAIIGAASLEGGPDGAERCMRELGIDIA